MKNVLRSLTLLILLAALPVEAATLQVAAFKCDATPPIGEPLIWATPLQTVVTPLLVKGIVLADGTNRYVLCVFDWCLIGNDSELAFRQALASAAGTLPERVSVHSIHQHAAPYGDEGAGRLLDLAPSPPIHLSEAFLQRLRAQMQAAVIQATNHFLDYDQIGIGEAKVERVASARRIRDANGKLLTRYSNGAKSKLMADLPEGDIDPMLKTITFAKGGKPLVRLHFYATHPQTFCCDGRSSMDFVGEAREELEQSEKIPELYFTGCAGDVTVGKYNDGSPEAYAGLKQRLGEGLRHAIAATHYERAAKPVWRNLGMEFPLRDDKAKVVAESQGWLNDPKASDTLRVYKGAMRLAYVNRLERPVQASGLQMGKVWIVNLPGEPMLTFQRFAQGLRKKEFVAVAGYGDTGTEYLCPDEAISEGGYEPAASNTGKGTDQVLRNAIKQVMNAPKASNP